MHDRTAQPHEDKQARLFQQGLELFNEGEWFEAHEVWEDAWHLAKGQRRLFLQGLIQCAVTLVHVERGNPRGVQNMFAAALPKFKDLPPVYLGVAVHDLLDRLEHFILPVLDMPRDAFEPGKGRGIEMPVDLKQAPKIELQYDPFPDIAK